MRRRKVDAAALSDNFDYWLYESSGAMRWYAQGDPDEEPGTASGEIDPSDRRNAIITDINLAPRNANGKVVYTATFTLIKPIDPSKGNGVLESSTFLANILGTVSGGLLSFVLHEREYVIGLILLTAGTVGLSAYASSSRVISHLWRAFANEIAANTTQRTLRGT